MKVLVESVPCCNIKKNMEKFQRVNTYALHCKLKNHASFSTDLNAFPLLYCATMKPILFLDLILFACSFASSCPFDALPFSSLDGML